MTTPNSSVGIINVRGFQTSPIQQFTYYIECWRSSRFNSNYQQFIEKLRSRSGQKRSNFPFHKCQQQGCLANAVWAQDSYGAFYFVVRSLKHAKIRIWVTSTILWYLWLAYRGTKCGISPPFLIYQADIFKTASSWWVLQHIIRFSEIQKPFSIFFWKICNFFLFQHCGNPR